MRVCRPSSNVAVRSGVPQGLPERSRRRSTEAQTRSCSQGNPDRSGPRSQRPPADAAATHAAASNNHLLHLISPCIAPRNSYRNDPYGYRKAGAVSSASAVPHEYCVLHEIIGRLLPHSFLEPPAAPSPFLRPRADWSAPQRRRLINSPPIPAPRSHLPTCEAYSKHGPRRPSDIGTNQERKR